MATIKFFTRTIAKKRNILVPVYVRVKSGRAVDVVCKADILTKPENWSNETQQARQRADTHRFTSGDSQEQKAGRKQFNKAIAGLREAIELSLTQARQEDITGEWLKTIIDKHWHPEKYKLTLFSYIQSFIDKAETKPNPKTGRPVSYKMRREYEVSFKYLKEFAEERKKPIDFKDIDLEFYDSYTQFLQKKKLATNTIGKKVQTLKIFLNAARDEGKNDYSVFKSRKFKTLTEEAETIYLNEDELTKIYELDLKDRPHLDRVRDLFLIGCWTGCRFSDIAQITPENISGGYIRIAQQKTGNRVTIPLHDVVTAILNKYGGTLPEAISNQKFNVSLKDIAKLAGLTDSVHKGITKGGVRISKMYPKYKLVTTHSARRSFCTNLYKSGFQTLSIMAISGHRTEAAFLKYIKVSDEEHAQKLQEHWGKRNLKIVS